MDPSTEYEIVSLLYIEFIITYYNHRLPTGMHGFILVKHLYIASLQNSAVAWLYSEKHVAALHQWNRLPMAYMASVYLCMVYVDVVAGTPSDLWRSRLAMTKWWRQRNQTSRHLMEQSAAMALLKWYSASVVHSSCRKPEDQNTIDICFVSSRDPGDWSLSRLAAPRSRLAGLLSTWATWGHGCHWRHGDRHGNQQGAS